MQVFSDQGPLAETISGYRMRQQQLEMALAIEAAIKTINANFKDGINGFEVEIEEFGKCFGTDDFKEGTTAFLEKRKANFRN
jgi:enoyl-CoA hydratase